MRQKGFVPNVITYSAAISACEKGKHWEEALRLLQEMLRGSLTLGVLVGLDIHFYEEGGLDTVELAATMAHELGHYLGLFHISESDGASHDPLADTPECYIASDADASGSLSADECGEPSARNVMFWTSAYGYDQDQLSTAQEWVLQRNPAILP